MPTNTEEIEALKARVAALEEGQGPGTTNASSPAVDAGAFWALEGLRARVPAPGAVMIVGDVVLPGERTAQWQQGHGTDDLLDDEWEHAAEVLAALGHPTRLALLRHVLRGVDSARSLGELEGMGTSGQVYHHLRQLVSAGWLRNRGARYDVPPERVVPLLATIVGARR